MVTLMDVQARQTQTFAARRRVEAPSAQKEFSCWQRPQALGAIVSFHRQSSGSS